MLCEDYNFKVNVKELIFDYLDLWEKEKQTKTTTGVHYHGSKKGEEENVTLFLNPQTKEYTAEDIAFAGFISMKMKPFINEVLKEVQ